MKRKLSHNKGDCVGWYPNKQRMYYKGTCIICWAQQNLRTRLPKPPSLEIVNLDYNYHNNKKSTLEFCIYLGKVLDRLNDKGENCGCKGYWLHECEIHKLCTINIKRTNIQLCSNCPDKDVSISEGEN